MTLNIVDLQTFHFSSGEETSSKEKIDYIFLPVDKDRKISVGSSMNGLLSFQD